MAKLSAKATKVALSMNTIAAAPTATAMAALSSSDDSAIYTASTGVYGILIPFEGAKNRRLLIKLENAASATKAVYVEKGTNKVTQPQNRVLVGTLAANGTSYVVLETGKYGHLEGDYKGNIVLTSVDANVKASYFLLP